jgi:methylated-DNA-[protein]-cysteine S-methyltransferase
MLFLHYILMTETDRKVSKNFFMKDKDVYKLLMEIPAGKIATYGDIAKALGHPFAARAVGNILNKNPNPIIVPCHRIICSNGKMGGYAYGSIAKRKLLEKEGIKFQNGSVKDFATCRIALKKAK